MHIKRTKKQDMCTYLYLPERSQEGHINQEIDAIDAIGLQVIDRLEEGIFPYILQAF